MGTREALRAVTDDWERIEARLSARQLRQLALFNAEVPEDFDPGEYLLSVLSEVLEPNDVVWEELRNSPSRRALSLEGDVLRSGAGSDPNEFLTENLQSVFADVVRRVLDPGFVDDAAADAIQEGFERTLLQLGVKEVDERRIGIITCWMRGRYVQPLFQFRSVEDEVLWPVISTVNEQLGVADDPLGACGWWLSHNAWLGATPADLLGTAREGAIREAADQLSNDNF
jgi:hypothetical protein